MFGYQKKKKKKDPKGTEGQGQKVAKANEKLIAQARDLAAKQDHPLKGNRITKAVETLQNLVPQEIEAAKEPIEKLEYVRAKVKEQVSSN